MSVFDVVGVVKYGNMVLQASTVKFEKGSKLVLAPSEKNMFPPKSLTIIADRIEVVDRAEITYDFDGLPGYDPDTPAPSQAGTVSNGANGSSISGEGSYPQAADGGPGHPGPTGLKGINGQDAPELQIFVGEIVQIHSDAIKVNFKGQDGGKGGKGGNGGKGGDGQKGAASQASDSWYDGDQCDREPGKGGNGGRGGDAGTPGSKGAGGKGGPQGTKNDPCPERAEYQGSDGPPGQSLDDVDPNWQTNFKGKDGADGESNTYELTGVPN